MEEEGHCVVFAYPGQGHINPLLQLSLRLATSMRIFVTLVTARKNHDAILAAWEREGVAAPWSRGVAMRMAAIPDEQLPPRTMAGMAAFVAGIKTLRPGFEELLAELVKNPNGAPPVSCVVSDSIMYWVPDVARAHGLPWAAYFPLPVSSFLLLGCRELPAIGFSSSDPGWEDDLVLHCPGVIPLHPSEAPLQGLRDDTSRTIDVARSDARWILINTCSALEGSLLAAAREQHGIHNIVPVAPLLPPSFVCGSLDRSPEKFQTSSLWEQDRSCLEWLDGQAPRSVLYLSFGSIASMRFSELETLLDGLLGAGEKFLWILRPDLVSGMSEEDHQRLLRRGESHGLIVRWAPQLQVLCHESIGAFLTHCGWNSTMESICAGVPMICWPFFADQKVNARYIVEAWKTGMRMAKGPLSAVTREDIVHAVSAMMRSEQGESIRRRALELRDACQREFQELSGLKKFAAELAK